MQQNKYSDTEVHILTTMGDLCNRVTIVTVVASTHRQYHSNGWQGGGGGDLALGGSMLNSNGRQEVINCFN